MDARLRGWRGGNVMKPVSLGEPLARFELTADVTDFSRDGSIPTTHIPHLAAVGGSAVTRTTSRFAFQKNGRALLTQDMLGEIQRAFLDVFPNSDVPGPKDGKL